MHLLGDAAWWLPRWLDRILPDVDVEGAALERTHPVHGIAAGSVGSDASADASAGADASADASAVARAGAETAASDASSDADAVDDADQPLTRRELREAARS